MHGLKHILTMERVLLGLLLALLLAAALLLAGH